MVRLGSTSYVYPADLVTNARQLAGRVQDIEIVLFDLPTGESNFPTPATVRALAAIAQEHGMTYTVHLPLDLYWQADTRHPALEVAERVIALTLPLSPFAYVFHIETRVPGAPAWRDAGHRAIEHLVSLVPTPELLCLENLESYAPDLLEPFFAAHPIKRTLDIGHLWKAGLHPFPYIATWLPHTRVVHLHGVADHAGKRTDHLSLAVLPPHDLARVMHTLHAFEGVLTLEVFEDDFWTSLTALADIP